MRSCLICILTLLCFICLSGKVVAQNTVICGDAIQLDIEDYKNGEIQWEFSKDSVSWTSIKDGTLPRLTSIITESGYYRAKISNCYSFFYSGIINLHSLKINDQSYSHNYQSIFKIDDIKWCNVPVPQNYIQDQTHPSILYIPQKWNGYNIWLATTPYPNDNFYENPCIYYGEYKDGSLNTNFQPILNNPIDKIAKKEDGFNADTELFLDESTLYCLYKKYLNSDKKQHYVIQTSLDGQYWTNVKDLFNSDLTGWEIVSPAILKYNNKYRIYGAQSTARIDKGVFNNLVVLESNTLKEPNFKIISKPVFSMKGNIEMWHFDLFERNNVLYMVFCGKNTNISGTYLSTYLAYSLDYINFTVFPKPLFSEVYSYRPTAFMDESDRFTLIISTMDPKHKVFSVHGNEIGATTIPFTNLLDLMNE